MKLGQKLRDKITKFEGIAICESNYLNGLTTYGLQAEMNEEGKIPNIQWVNSEQLEVVDEELADVTPSPSGGGPNPPAR